VGRATAITFFDRALALKKAEYGDDAVEVATTMNELGRLYFRLGRNEETLAIWRRALEIREMAKAGKEDHDIGTRPSYASLYSTRAEPTLTNATAGLAISLNNLALIYEKMGRWQEAEPTYKRGTRVHTPVHSSSAPR
jgi:tetratricopeptide (TPR) repeat protein